MKTINDFKEYELIDMCDGEKLERWGDVILVRPDPQIIWTKKKTSNLWNKADAIYIRSDKGGGHWNLKNSIPNSWNITYQEMNFNLKLMNFKHTGLFPEQANNWNYVMNKLSNTKDKKILNLFSYTGAMTVACLKAGATVVHVDSSKGMVEWAKENVNSSGFKEARVRYIVDDVIKFVKREIRRENKYDGIIMDPPSFGKGSNGEIWKFENNFIELLKLCEKLLTKDSLFVLVSTYTTGFSNEVIKNCLETTVNNVIKGTVKSDEIGIKSSNGLTLPCGISTICEKNNY